MWRDISEADRAAMDGPVYVQGEDRQDAYQYTGDQPAGENQRVMVLSQGRGYCCRSAFRRKGLLGEERPPVQFLWLMRNVRLQDLTLFPQDLTLFPYHVDRGLQLIDWASQWG